MIRQECKDFVTNLGKDEELRRGFNELFENISRDADIRELPQAGCIIACYDENSNLEVGDWAPEIHLILRKVDSVEQPDTEPEAEPEAEPNADSADTEEEERTEGRLLPNEPEPDKVG